MSSGVHGRVGRRATQALLAAALLLSPNAAAPSTADAAAPSAATWASLVGSVSNAPAVSVPLVPVTGFWSTQRSVSRAALAGSLAGGTRQVYVSAADLPSLAASLAVTPGPNVHALSPAGVLAAVQASPTSLGILRPEDVNPSVRMTGGSATCRRGRSRWTSRRVPRRPPSMPRPPGRWSLAATSCSTATSTSGP